MLHDGIGHQNEVAGNPAANRNRYCSSEMSARSESFLAPDQRADEGALEKEREHPFHGQRLSNYSAGIFGKIRPVSSKLEFHRNSGDHPDGKVQSENLCPKPDGSIVFFIAR